MEYGILILILIKLFSIHSQLKIANKINLELLAMTDAGYTRMKLFIRQVSKARNYPQGE